MNLFTSKEQKNYFFSCFRADLLRIIADPKFKKNINCSFYITNYNYFNNYYIK